jgi:hypothetical protein
MKVKKSWKEKMLVQALGFHAKIATSQNPPNGPSRTLEKK